MIEENYKWFLPISPIGVERVDWSMMEGLRELAEREAISLMVRHKFEGLTVEVEEE